MTSPSGDSDGGGGQSAPAPARKAGPKVDVGTVGQYTHHDHILGRTHTGLGVVAAVGEVLEVRPLAEHYVQVDPADFAPLNTDDL